MLKDLKYLLVFALGCYTNAIYAETSCDLPEEKTYRADIIELGDLACDDFLDCVLILNFPKEFENTKFKKISLMGDADNHHIMPALLTTEVKDHLSSHLYGSQDFLTSLKFRIVFEPVKGCSIWSTLILE